MKLGFYRVIGEKDGCEILTSVPHAVFDGYDIAERLLEGVMIRLTIAEDGATVLADGHNQSDRDYLENLNKAKYMEIATTSALVVDSLTYMDDVIMYDHDKKWNEKGQLSWFGREPRFTK